jgi:hypothetical protein
MEFLNPLCPLGISPKGREKIVAGSLPLERDGVAREGFFTLVQASRS